MPLLMDNSCLNPLNPLNLLNLYLKELEGFGWDGGGEGEDAFVGGDGGGSVLGTYDLGLAWHVLRIIVTAVQTDDFGGGGLRLEFQAGDVDDRGAGLLLRVDDLHNDFVLGLVYHGTGKDAVLPLLHGVGSRCATVEADGGGQHIRATVEHVELLDVVGSGAGGGEVVVPDEVGAPLPALDVGEEGCVCGHVYEVGVALDVGHEGGFVDAGSGMVVLLASVVAGPFAGKDARAVLGVERAVAVAVHPVLVPLYVAVEVFVHEVGLQLAHGSPAVAEVVVLGIGAAGADELDFGVCLAHFGGDDGEAVEEGLLPLFVADGEELEVEGCGMPHVGAELGPLVGGGVAVGKVDEVYAVVDELLEALPGGWGMGIVAVLVLAGHAHVEYGQGLGTYLLRELEILEEAESVALEVVGEVAVREGVVPAVLVERTVLHGAYGVLPLVAGRQVCTLHDTAAGEAEHAGVEVLQRLCHIHAEPVLVSFVGLDGEEADVLEVGGHLAVAPHAEVSLGKGLFGLDDGCVLLPLLAADVQPHIAQLLVLVHRGVIDEVNPKLGTAAVGHTRPDGEAVLLAALHADAEEAVILNHGVLVAMPRGRQAHIVGVAVEGAVVPERHLAGDVPSGKVVGKLETAVLHQLGIQAAVGSIVDVLEEDAVHGGLDVGTGFLGVDGDDIFLCLSGQGGERKCSADKDVSVFHSCYM